MANYLTLRKGFTLRLLFSLFVLPFGAFAQQANTQGNSANTSSTTTTQNSATPADDDFIYDTEVTEEGLVPSINVDTASEKYLNLTAGIDYESTHLSKGKKSADAVIHTSLAASMYGVTAGLWVQSPLDPSANSADATEYDFSLSYSRAITDWLNSTTGLVYELYPDTNSDPGHVWGITSIFKFHTVPLNPSFAYRYKITRKRHELYFIIGDEIDLQPYIGYENFFVSFSANTGYAFQDNNDYGSTENGWAWVMGQLNFGGYFFDNQLRLSLGPQFATNNDGAERNNGDSTRVAFGTNAVFAF